jgi:8-oxo-dGTP diphosphatase
MVSPDRWEYLSVEPMAMRVVGAAVIEGGRVLAARRGPGRALAGLWEFPGGKVDPGEDDRTALARELIEELALTVEVNEAIGISEHRWPEGAIDLVVYRCRRIGDPPVRTEHEELRWLAPHELETVEWAPADRPLLGRVALALS